MSTPLVTWNMVYLTGIPDLDAQHRHLLDIINSLHQGLVEAGQDRESLFRQAAKECVVYVQKHFADEERYLLEHHYPGVQAQKQAHTLFTQRLLTDVQRFEKGDRLAPNRLVKFLAEWLVDHIAFEDKKYGLFFSSRPENPTP